MLASVPPYIPMPHDPPGLFITGTDTGVGKTYVAALIARALVASGRRVGVYKPAASGCTRDAQGRIVSDDAVALWEAAGRPGDLEHVCPQRFLAPLAPHLAARAEGKTLDADLLRAGLDYWKARSDIILVEGARRADVAAWASANTWPTWPWISAIRCRCRREMFWARSTPHCRRCSLHRTIAAGCAWLAWSRITLRRPRPMTRALPRTAPSWPPDVRSRCLPTRSMGPRSSIVILIG